MEKGLGNIGYRFSEYRIIKYKEFVGCNKLGVDYSQSTPNFLHRLYFRQNQCVMNEVLLDILQI